MSPSQIPLLIVLIVALGLVLMLIRRQLAAPDRSTGATPAPAPGSTGMSTGMSTATPKPAPARTTARAPTMPQASSPSPVTSSAVASWGYQLQDLDIDAAARSPFDLIVIDTTLDGSDDTALTPADLARLKTKPDGSRRRVLAYLSIGEAESYRAYWDKSWKRNKPDWLLGENPDWKENYAVCFWSAGWQGLMCGAPDARLDRILAAGFDGVYLDKCDVFDDLKDHYKAVAKSRPDIEGDMVQFIARLAAYAKARNPGFMVVMQNAEALLERPEARAALDGVAKEELVYGCDGVEKLNTPADFNDTRENLDRIRADGKLVLVVEYLDDPAKIAHAREVVARLGYVLTISDKDRELSRLGDAPLVA